MCVFRLYLYICFRRAILGHTHISSVFPADRNKKGSKSQFHINSLAPPPFLCDSTKKGTFTATHCQQDARFSLMTTVNAHLVINVFYLKRSFCIVFSSSQGLASTHINGFYFDTVWLRQVRARNDRTHNHSRFRGCC